MMCLLVRWRGSLSITWHHSNSKTQRSHQWWSKSSPPYLFWFENDFKL